MALQEIERDVIELQAQVRANGSALMEMKQKLFGNHQPGILQLQEERIGRLEKALYKGLGALGLLAILLEATFAILKLIHK